MSSRAKRQEKYRNKMKHSAPLLKIKEPKDDKPATCEYWYKKPVGIIFLSVTAAIITAMIIGIFKHFASPVKEEAHINTLSPTPIPKLVTPQQVKNQINPKIISIQPQQIIVPPVITMTGNITHNTNSLIRYEGPNPPTMLLKDNLIYNAKDIVSISAFPNMTKASREGKTK